MKKQICLIIISLSVFLPIIGCASEEYIPLIQNLLPSTTSAGTQDQPSIKLNMLELAWSAETYAPLDYQGRTLPIKGSMVDVDAIISITGENTGNLKFSWFLDNTFQESKSGYGKTSFRFGVRKFNGDFHNVLVKIFNEDRSFYIEKSIEIPIARSEVVLKQSNMNQLSILAKPYFFSIDKLTDLEFQWTLEGQEPIISSNYNADILDINIKNKNLPASEYQLGLVVKNLRNTIQSANSSIKINL